MPNSKRRKRQVAANKRQVERAKRQLEDLREENPENQKENIYPPASKIARGGSDDNQCGAQAQDGSGWAGGLYSWCQSGITQVCNINVNEIVRSFDLDRMTYLCMYRACYGQYVS